MNDKAAEMTAEEIVTAPIERTKAASSAFVDTLNIRRRCRRRPPPSLRARRVPRPTYFAAARLKPRLCKGSQHSMRVPQTPDYTEGVDRKRPVHLPKDRDAAGEASFGLSAKRPRQVSPARGSLSFLSSDLFRRRYGGVRRPDKVVTFSEPLVSETRTRPRTLGQDIPLLFYGRADEARFRKKFRRERRLRAVCGWDSDSDEDEDDIEVAEKAKLVMCKDENDPNEVTESDENSASSDSDDGSTGSDEECGK